MVKFKISVNHNLCIGCGACEQNCDNFKLTDGKSSPVNSEVDEIGCNQEASDGCPVSAISVEEI
ncbi:ferredoxin [Candidatus Woesearchaeota archaeon]|nr:ferredoxin [Candidatus Woesearchaeota archaeon]